MPSTVRVVEQKFYSQYNNGISFTDNKLTDFATHLKGGVLETLQAEFTVEVDWNFELFNEYIIYYDLTASTLRLSQNNMDLISEGFAVGDEIKISINDDVVGKMKIECNITAISNGEFSAENVSITLTSGTGIVDGVNKIVSNSADIITGLTEKTALDYRFGLIENDEPFNTLSKLTNTDQRYLVDGIDHATGSLSAGVAAGNNKAWVTSSFDTDEIKVSFEGLVLDKDYIYPENTTQQFLIVHEFSINPLYRDGEEDSLTGTDIPPTDIFNGDMSLKYVFQTEFRTVLNNPNTANISQHDTGQGSVGYLNESFNGFPNDFQLNDITYTDSNGNEIDKLAVDEVTTVTATILSNNLILQTDNPLIVGHTAILDSSKYSNSTKEYDEIWFNESLKTSTAAGSTVSGDIIKAYEVTNQTSGQIDFTFEVDLRASDIVESLEDNQQYLLYFVLGDSSKTVDQGTKVTGRLDVNTYSKSSDINGLLTVSKFEQYPSSYEFESGVSTGFQNAKTFNESGLMLNTEFTVLGSSLIQNIDFEVVIFNTDNNTWSTIRKLPIDISNNILMPKASGFSSQQIELDSTRGYILKDTDQFNYLKMSTGDYDAGQQDYSLQIGYKIPWQNWLELKNAPAEFYDKSKDYNGLNQKASEYSNISSLGNFEIRCLLNMTLRQDSSGVDTQYVITSDKFDVYDYDTDDQDPNAYTATINTFDENGVELENNIINNNFTEVRAVFTPTTPPTFSESVDFTEVSDDWTRFAHGNKYSVSLAAGARRGDWTNEQANTPDDLFTDGTTEFNKDSALLYSSSPSSILANQNCNALYGCYSLNKYEYYGITGKMYSTDNDDDVIAYNIAFHTDEDGVEHTISLCATTGGVLLDKSTTYIQGDDSTSSIEYNSPKKVASWALVYNFGKGSCKQLLNFNTTESGFDWNDSQVQDLEFEVNRSGKDIEVGVSWEINGTTFTNTFNYDLNNDTETARFLGFQNIGFSFMSQVDGGFKDVDLIQPLGDYYGELRIEPKNSSSDLGVSVLKTDIEAPRTSLLKQISGDEKKAVLSFDGTNFILQGLVDTSKVENGQNYRFSAELRTKNLLV